MKKKLIIELLSDCLPGSGAGNGSYIDTDCVFDAYGFPFIPSKRIKGCLRETAEKLQSMGYADNFSEEIHSIFGTEDKDGSIRIGNAYLQGIKSIHQAVEYYKVQSKKGNKVDFILMPDAIQEYYTCLHARTAIDENGIAKDKSLRTVRAICKGNVFEAEINYPEEKEAHIQTMVKALRYIGTNRNRGFGHVKLTLADTTADKLSVSGEEGNVLELRLRLKTPVLVDEMHIPGVMIRGALAALWMNHHEAPEGGDYSQCEVFRKLFIDELRYEPAFPTDKDGTRYLPVPASVVRYKVPEPEKREYIDLAVDKAPNAQTKRISAGTVYAPVFDHEGGKCEISENRMYMIQPTRREFMHHAQSGELFTYSALEEGERYLARISGDLNAIETLLCFLKRHDIKELRIGRSRTVQYGSVEIEKLERRQSNDVSVTGRRFAMTLQTPAILLDQCGTPVTDCNSLFKALKETCKDLSGKTCNVERCFSVGSSVEGYNPQWKLSKQPVPALGATTTVVFSVSESEEVVLPEFVWLGERNTEGYGLVHIRKADMNTDLEKVGFDAAKLVEKEDTKENDFGSEWKCFFEKFRQKYILDKLRILAMKNDNGNYSPNSRTLQRLYAFVLTNSDNTMDDIQQYIIKIKDPDKKRHCDEIMNTVKKELSDESMKKLIDSLKGKVLPPIDIKSEEVTAKNYQKFYLTEKLRIAILGKRKKAWGGKMRQ